MISSAQPTRAAAVGLAWLLAWQAPRAAPPEPTSCSGPSPAPFCRALRGDRAEGWLAQSRSEVLARRGMVVTSQPLAAEAGLRVLQQGGNAIDAAVAAAATLNVTEPMMTGLAGDLFALIYIARDKKVYVLNASGVAPSGATVARFNSLGYHADPRNFGPGSGMPMHGVLPVTVPGALWGWEEVLRRFGTLSFKEVLASAVDYAEHGFPVSERIASDWVLPTALPLKACCQELDPDSVRAWYVNGAPPRVGQVFANPELARTLRLIAQGGRDVFYKGEIARAIVAKSSALGGTLTLEDLAQFRGEWVEPARITYRGYEILELPPPSQAWGALEILGILAACVPRWLPGQTLASLGPAEPRYWHFLIEAKKLAYQDLFAYNADPRFTAVPTAKLLSPAYAAAQCARVDPQHASVRGPKGSAAKSGDTVVLSTADSQGNMVSWVNSNFDHFGSGLTVPGYGFVLHDRGALFSLDPGSPNAIAPGKRPFNTLSAGFVLRSGEPVMTVTLMGGDMQAQGHAQLLINVFDLGANVQAAADMARFRHDQIGNVVHLESPLFQSVGRELSALGHEVRSANGAGMGGVQVIRYENGVLRSGSDPRKDGQAAGW